MNWIKIGLAFAWEFIISGAKEWWKTTGEEKLAKKSICWCYKKALMSDNTIDDRICMNLEIKSKYSVDCKEKRLIRDLS
jgi:hypothetical protein